MKYNLIIESWRDFLNEQNKNIWVIQKGQNLTSIAKWANVPVTAVIGANPQIKDVNLIYPGQRINIPDGQWSDMSKNILTRRSGLSSLWKEVDKLCADLKKKIKYPINYKTSRSFGPEDGGLTYASTHPVWSEKSIDQQRVGDTLWPVEIAYHDMDLYSRAFDKRLGQVFAMLKKAIGWLHLKQAEIFDFDDAPTKRGDVQNKAMVPEGTLDGITAMTTFMTAVFISVNVRHEMLHMIHREHDYAKSKAAGKGVGFFGTERERTKRAAESEKLCRIADFRWVRGDGRKHLERAQMFLQILLGDIVDATFSSENTTIERKRAEGETMIVATSIMSVFHDLLNQEREDAESHMVDLDVDVDQLWDEPV